ncbi:sulfurtransferase-like selenium metabolism protein YedF [Phascolarctobacterium sp.]|uniref:sulfurtransferase-like selenium metabolism protein YedF n=1 Tax=Phascolarctobacterium sp. TaxID=2049039 RepID=UPI0038679AC2
MITVNAMGDACPIPVVKTKNAIKGMQGAGQVEIFVDNEIAVQNLTKMAQQKGYGVSSAKVEEGKYRVEMTVGDAPAVEEEAQEETCLVDARSHKLVAITSECMGEGDPVLGKLLMKGFIFALTQQDILPETILCYNGGAHWTCEGSPALEDLKSLEAQGVEILTCGTCLNHYDLAEKLAVGGVTNMYVICEKMLNAASVVKP